MSVGNDGDFAPGERKRRSWTRDEKRRIVDESVQEGASIAEVARRHELNANLLFTWRRKMGVEPSEQNDPMEIVLAEGDRILVWADVETAALTRVLKALSRR